MAPDDDDDMKIIFEKDLKKTNETNTVKFCNKNSYCSESDKQKCHRIANINVNINVSIS